MRLVQFQQRFRKQHTGRHHPDHRRPHAATHQHWHSVNDARRGGATHTGEQHHRAHESREQDDRCDGPQRHHHEIQALGPRHGGGHAFGYHVDRGHACRERTHGAGGWHKTANPRRSEWPRERRAKCGEPRPARLPPNGTQRQLRAECRDAEQQREQHGREHPGGDHAVPPLSSFDSRLAMRRSSSAVRSWSSTSCVSSASGEPRNSVSMSRRSARRWAARCFTFGK